ncbi:unnamed protein product [Enterobius vermicularis]|uniref:Ovule protein n=1 Tax=Enterobius vermicularis TaxID=51028 RepID=A0A0N4VLV9_ENTVE|nr:unnamed protein product [Enterobius vermicularis]
MINRIDINAQLQAMPLMPANTDLLMSTQRTSFQSPVAQPNDYRLYNYANMVTGGTPTSWYFSSNPLQSITYEVDNAPLIWMINQLQDQQNLLSVNALTLSTTSAPTTPKLFTDFIQVEANKKIYGLSSKIKDMPLDYKNNPKPVPLIPITVQDRSDRDAQDQFVMALTLQEQKRNLPIMHKTSLRKQTKIYEGHDIKKLLSFCHGCAEIQFD